MLSEKSIQELKQKCEGVGFNHSIVVGVHCVSECI